MSKRPSKIKADETHGSSDTSSRLRQSKKDEVKKKKRKTRNRNLLSLGTSKKIRTRVFEKDKQFFKNT